MKRMELNSIDESGILTKYLCLVGYNNNNFKSYGCDHPDLGI